MYTVKRILVPLDYSDISREALNAALQIASLHGAKVFLLQVEENLDKELKERILTAPNETVIEDTIQQGEQALLEAVKLERRRCAEAGHPLPDIEVDVRVSGGDVVEECLNIIRDFEIDLLVTGTHGRDKGLLGMLRGSNSEKLVERAPCSVMVIKPPGYPYLRD